jgi:hypothetical protein
MRAVQREDALVRQEVAAQRQGAEGLGPEEFRRRFPDAPRPYAVPPIRAMAEQQLGEYAVHGEGAPPSHGARVARWGTLQFDPQAAEEFRLHYQGNAQALPWQHATMQFGPARETFPAAVTPGGLGVAMLHYPQRRYGPGQGEEPAKRYAVIHQQSGKAIGYAPAFREAQALVGALHTTGVDWHQPLAATATNLPGREIASHLVQAFHERTVPDRPMPAGPPLPHGAPSGPPAARVEEGASPVAPFSLTHQARVVAATPPAATGAPYHPTAELPATSHTAPAGAPPTPSLPAGPTLAPPARTVRQ